MNEKFGVKEGMLWQLKTMWPLALYSLVSSATKLNYLAIEQERGPAQDMAEKVARTKEALGDAASGLWKNKGFIANVVSQSVLNFLRYFVPVQEQDARGLQIAIGEVFSKKLINIGKLFKVDELGEMSHADGHGGILQDDPATRAVEDVIEKIMLKIGEKRAAEKAPTEPATEKRPEPPTDQEPGGGEDEPAESLEVRLRRAIDDEDYDTVSALGKELGVEDVDILMYLLRDYKQNRKFDNSPQKPVSPESILGYLNPLEILDKATDLKRIRKALGHNMGDVVDVFPFQAGCVPFLTTAFKDTMGGLEKLGVPESMQDLIMFFLIMMFSWVADNYVACKVGLEVMPDKPHIPLIAAIQGGSMTAIGNMANIAQFDLEKYPLAESFKKMGWHVDNVTASIAYSYALTAWGKMGFVNVPKPIASAAPSSEKKPHAKRPSNKKGEPQKMSKLEMRQAAERRAKRIGRALIGDDANDRTDRTT